MHRRRESLQLDCPLESAYAAAILCHWPTLALESISRVRAGQRYLRHEGRTARHGRIIDAQPPTLFVLRELLVAPVPVMRIYLRYRFEPRGGQTLLLLETRLTLFAPARVTPWVWQSRVTEENSYRLRRARSLAEAGGHAGEDPVGSGKGPRGASSYLA
ncbi:MAG: hypothetical protein JJU27_11290 [Gammaproteobacteria bacterium]|nr:hypothetical protein [Gammaproteobacteria bacterium]